MFEPTAFAEFSSEREVILGSESDHLDYVVMFLRKLRNFVGFRTTGRSMRREEPKQDRSIPGNFLTQRRNRAVGDLKHFKVDYLVSRLKQRQVLRRGGLRRASVSCYFSSPCT